MTSETTLLVEYFAVILLRTLKRNIFQPNNKNNKNLAMDVPLGEWLFLFAASRSNWNSENWFLWRKKNGRTWKKTLEARTRINDKLKLHVSPSLGIQLGLQ